MKTLIAHKLNKEWKVIITDNITASDETDIRKIIRENGLLYDEHFSQKDDKGNLIKIYAD